MANGVLAGALAGVALEDTLLEAHGDVFVTVPPGTGLFIPGSVPGRFGTFTLLASGAWSYALDNSSLAVQSLGANVVEHELFVATWGGGEEQIQGVIDIAVTGVNDVATFSGNLTGSLNATLAAATSGNVAVDDADVGEKEFQVVQNVSGSVGTFSITKAGAWTYTLAGGQQTAIVDESKTIREAFTVAATDGTVTEVVVYISTSETAAPTVTSFSPTDNATGVAATAAIDVVFSESVRHGTGTIRLREGTGDVVATYDAAAPLSISGNTLHLDPVFDFRTGSSFSLEFDAGAILDYAGNAYAGTLTYNFSTVVPASVVQTGGPNAETLTGNNGTDTLSGLGGNDTLVGMFGNDALTGGAGRDLAVYSGARSQYTVTKGSGNFTVARTGEGTDTLVEVERLQFSEDNLALDLEGSAGSVAKVLGILFGAASVSNTTYAGIGIGAMDAGLSYDGLMGAAINAVFPGISNAALVDLLYFNLVGIHPDVATAQPFVAYLDLHQLTQSQLAVLAADTSFNTNNIDLAGLTQHGLAYVVY